MTNMINSSLFQSIKGALAEDKNNSSLAEILKTEPGYTYTVRLLPDTKNPKNTFFHFFTHGWTSYSTGQYIAALSPQTFGERDPIAEERYRVLRTGTDSEKEKIKSIGRSEKWLVNVFVVNDPVNPDNNGKVKILRYGKQLQKIIKDAIDGEEAEDFGPRIFDLSPNGVNLKIKVEKQGEYPSYVSSKFGMPSAIQDIDDVKAKKIYDSVHDLTKVFTLKSYDELRQMINEHFYCTVVKDEADPVTEPDDDHSKPIVKATTKAKPSTQEKPASNKSVDDEIKDILDSLELDK